jgi:GNAT superfamily N-acetyltransferase
MRTIRHCERDEGAAILAIINSGAEAYRGVIPAERRREPYMTRAELQRDLTAGVEFVGLEDTGELVGVMALQRVRDVHLIRHAYVVPHRQRQGVGAALLEHLCARASTQILVGTWAAAAWAIRFYERHGFTLVPPPRGRGLLEMYWDIPAAQADASVVLAKPAVADR